MMERPGDPERGPFLIFGISGFFFFYSKLVRMIVRFSFMTWMDMVVGPVVSMVIMVVHVLIKKLRFISVSCR